ncbi:SDR family NAD(P)-dependent oxidoreductase [Novosphingobium bradum]|uniref:SDR family NAD(P)-dependent oxidoreductase n=1 Tax=Novosphingobium bradum TaxID=1737444 RepID=A0ABV7IVZ6_9SPHN
MANKVAFITGASRGIGKVCATELAAAGFDVAITARTVKEGEEREHSSTIKRSDTSALPGSLEGTIELVRAHGVQGLTVQADLLDPASLGAAVTTVLERWGRIDVIVHNGRYIGPGHMDRLADTPIELIRKQIEANAIAPLIINQLALPSMVRNGGGTIVNISSSSGYSDPPAAAGDGGWALGYGMSKGAMRRISGILKLEYAGKNINFFDVQPGFISTERIKQDMAGFGFDASKGAPCDVPARVVRWLVTNPEAARYNGMNIEGQQFCHEMGLMPEWPGPAQTSGVKAGAGNYDWSGWRMSQAAQGKPWLQAYEESL